MILYNPPSDVHRFLDPEVQTLMKKYDLFGSMKWLKQVNYTIYPWDIPIYLRLGWIFIVDIRLCGPRQVIANFIRPEHIVFSKESNYSIANAIVNRHKDTRITIFDALKGGTFYPFENEPIQIESNGREINGTRLNTGEKIYWNIEYPFKNSSIYRLSDMKQVLKIFKPQFTLNRQIIEELPEINLGIRKFRFENDGDIYTIICETTGNNYKWNRLDLLTTNNIIPIDDKLAPFIEEEYSSFNIDVERLMS